MKSPQFSEDNLSNASREEIMAALFADMVISHSNMAFMMLGKIPNPQDGKTVKDLEAAKHFIDQLEMLEFKTKGNLGKQEEKLLQQSLTALRMAFVEVIEEGEGAEEPAQKESASAPSGEQPKETKGKETAEAPISEEPADPGEEPRKKFSKKYDA